MKNRSRAFCSLLFCLFLVNPFASDGMSQTRINKKKKAKSQQEACCDHHAAAEPDGTLKMGEVALGDYHLTDQNGNEVRLADLLKDKVVVMNFLFTTCTTICPPMGANISELNRRLADKKEEGLTVVSISIDPVNDTPERLKAWSDKFNPGPGWTLLTGEKSDVDQLLKDLKVFTPLKEDHAPIVMIGKEGEDNWIRTNGLADVDLLESTIRGYFPAPEGEEEIADPAPAKPEASTTSTPRQIQDQSYFTDTKLIDQSGEEFRFYSDLMKGKVVFINPFFAECTGSCPAMHNMMKEVQIWLGDRLGDEVNLLSISIDPLHDTPNKLGEYAESYNAQEGWHFLSGEVENVNLVTRKIGKYVEQREVHDAVILIGNLDTGLWKKVNGLATPQDVIKVLESVMNDESQ